MGIIVQKFGGSSVSNTDKLFNICKIISRQYDSGHNIAVVVSAQGKTTDKLILEEKEITSKNYEREHDVLVSVGEQITIAKLAMCLNEQGYDAVSFTGWQLPILTTNEFGNAKIKTINTQKILESFSKHKIVIIAGFQGIDENGNITTLGRGGSDTTAVALAASLDAEWCDIYTDVDGVFSSDPRIIENVQRINKIRYEEMLELASLGAKVLHNRCIEIGKNYNIPINVKSSFNINTVGTSVNNEKDLESIYISGVSKDDNISRITIIGKNTKIGRAYKVFKLLAKNNITTDTIVQCFGEHAIKDISFTIKDNCLSKVLEILNSNLDELELQEIKHCENLSKISVVGVGIATDPNVASKIFEALYENNINMQMISTSEIKISILVNKNEAELALKKIHDKFF